MEDGVHHVFIEQTHSLRRPFALDQVFYGQQGGAMWCRRLLFGCRAPKAVPVAKSSTCMSSTVVEKQPAVLPMDVRWRPRSGVRFVQQLMPWKQLEEGHSIVNTSKSSHRSCDRSWQTGPCGCSGPRFRVPSNGVPTVSLVRETGKSDDLEHLDIMDPKTCWTCWRPLKKPLPFVLMTQIQLEMSWTPRLHVLFFVYDATNDTMNCTEQPRSHGGQLVGRAQERLTRPGGLDEQSGTSLMTWMACRRQLER